MFTGIIEKIGTIQSTSEENYGKSLKVKCTPWDTPIQRGESIALSGCCLTVTNHEIEGDRLFLSFDVIPETLNVTTLGSWVEGECVNIERAVTAETPLGGHLVQGHVDYLSSLNEIKKVNGDYVLVFSLTTDMKYKIVEKGCIAINGVSLTVSSLDANAFEVSLIPETLKMTNLKLLKVGNAVNIETDVMTRSIYSIVQKVLATKQQV